MAADDEARTRTRRGTDPRPEQRPAARRRAVGRESIAQQIPEVTGDYAVADAAGWIVPGPGDQPLVRRGNRGGCVNGFGLGTDDEGIGGGIG